MRTVDAAGLPVGDGHPPRIMGVLNVSSESPYEPSVFDDPAAAARYVDEELISQGADIVDVGLESANKRFEALSAADELERLGTAIETVERVDGDAVFSIETRYHEVADRALGANFDMVNDVCGFADPEMPRVCREHDAAVVKMASPPDLERPGAIEDVDEIYDALADGLTEKTIVDPAFGGWSEEKTLADDRETFDRLREFRALDRPVLVSINRKNFLRDVAGRSTEEALPVSLAATSMAVERGAHVVRTHDVAETRDAARIGHAFTADRVRTDRVEELDVRTVGEAARHIERAGGDPGVAPEGVGAAVALRDLAAGERETVVASGRDAGAAVEGQDPTVLAGTARAVGRVADALARGGYDELAAAVRRASA